MLPLPSMLLLHAAPAMLRVGLSLGCAIPAIGAVDEHTASLGESLGNLRGAGA